MSSKYEKITPKCTLAEIELADSLRAQIQEIIEDRGVAHALEAEGLVPRKRVLLHGPPGCGKTSIAHALAAELKLPLYLASAAQIENAYIGEAEKNIEKVFKFVETTECVFLFDEFETFAKDRGRAAHYVQSTVNTFLVNLERRAPKGIFIACTNFADMLDAAIARRFDIICEVPPLTNEMMIKVAQNVLKDRFDICPAECVAAGKTPSGVVREATNRLRSEVLKREKINPTPKPQPKVTPPSREDDSIYGVTASSGFANEQMDYQSDYEKTLRELGRSWRTNFMYNPYKPIEFKTVEATTGQTDG